MHIENIHHLHYLPLEESAVAARRKSLPRHKRPLIDIPDLEAGHVCLAPFNLRSYATCHYLAPSTHFPVCLHCPVHEGIRNAHVNMSNNRRETR